MTVEEPIQNLILRKEVISTAIVCRLGGGGQVRDLPRNVGALLLF